MGTFGNTFGNSLGAQGSLLNLVPQQSNALFILDGLVIEFEGNKYLRDVSGNNRHFLITNHDFDVWVSLGLPLRTKATISAPAGDAILEAVYPKLYSGGVPVQFGFDAFSNLDLDFDNQFFAKFVDGEYDAVTGAVTKEATYQYICLYSTARTGASLTACQSFFGSGNPVVGAYYCDPVNGVDATTGGRNGSTKAKAWKTATYVETQITTGTVYVLSGNLLMANGICEKAINWVGIGNVTATGTNTGVLRFNTSELVRSFTGIALDGENTRHNIFFYTTVKNVTFNKCRFINPKTSSGSNCSLPTALTNVGNIIFNDCVMINSGTGTGYCTSYATEVNRGRFFSNRTYAIVNRLDPIKVHNAIISGAYTNYGIYTNKEYDVIGCKIANTLTGMAIYNNAVNTVTGCKFNDNTFNGVDVTAQPVYLGGEGTECKHNTITLTGTGTTGVNGVAIIYSVGLIAPDIDGNVIDKASNVAGGSGVVLTSNGVTCTDVKVKNNIIRFRNDPSSAPIVLDGEEIAAGKFNGFEITGNQFFGAKYYGGDYGTCHGIFIHANTGLIDNNTINGSFAAITVKGEETDCAGLTVSNNIAANCPKGLVYSGVTNITDINNTLDNSYDVASAANIMIIKNAAYKSTGHSFADQRVYFRGVGTNNTPIYYIDHADNLVGLTASGNTYYTSTPAKFANVAGTYYTFAEWQTLTGQDADAVLLLTEPA